MATPNNEKPIIVAFTLDFETGGLDCQDCACTQIAIHAVRIDTFETIDRYVKYISPYNKQPDKGVAKRKVLKSKFDKDDEQPMKYEEKALTYSAITMDMLESLGMDIKQVAAEVIDFIRKNILSKGRNIKPFLIGQNIGFDIGFMQQLMEYGGQMKEFAKLMRGETDFYGHFQPLYIDDAHDADSDVTATTNVAMVCSQRMRNASGIDDGSMVMTKTEKSRVHFKI